jgi:hypothetical protein
MFTNLNEFERNITDGRESHQGLKNSYVSFNNLLMSWGKSLENQVQQISDWMIHLFKYASYEIKNSKELIKKTNEIEAKYVGFKKSLDYKKEKLY